MAHIDTNILENYTTGCNIKTAYCEIHPPIYAVIAIALVIVLFIIIRGDK